MDDGRKRSLPMFEIWLELLVPILEVLGIFGIVAGAKYLFEFVLDVLKK